MLALKSTWLFLFQVLLTESFSLFSRSPPIEEKGLSMHLSVLVED